MRTTAMKLEHLGSGLASALAMLACACGGGPGEPVGAGDPAATGSARAALSSEASYPRCHAGNKDVLCALATDQSNASAIAYAGGAIFFTDQSNGDIKQVSTLGGAVSLLGKGRDNGSTVAANPSAVFYAQSSSGVVGTIPVGGGPLTKLATRQGTADNITIDTVNAYYDNDSELLSVPLAGGALPTLLASGLYWTGSITTNGDNQNAATTVVWRDKNPADQTTRIMSVPVGGGTPTQLASLSSADYPGTIDTDGINVYGTSYAGDYVFSVPIGGGPLTVLVSGQTGAMGIKVTPGGIYWTNSTTSGQVMAANLDGSGVRTIASGQGYPTAVTFDGHHVYWTNAYDGQGVMRAPK